MAKKPKIIGYIEIPNSVCRNCKYRKELCKIMTQQCLDCGFLNQRNEPYFSKLPVYEDQSENKSDVP